VFIFGSVRFLSKKVTKPNYFFKKKPETESKPVQTDRFRFGFLKQKPVQTGLARFWLGLARFFSVRVRFGSVQFGFFNSRPKKPKPNRSGFSKF
jgi:hypothetical protein